MYIYRSIYIYKYIHIYKLFLCSFCLDQKFDLVYKLHLHPDDPVIMTLRDVLILTLLFGPLNLILSKNKCNTK